MKRRFPAAMPGLGIFLATMALPAQAAEAAEAAEAAPMDPDPYGIVIKPVPEKTVVLSFDCPSRSDSPGAGRGGRESGSTFRSAGFRPIAS